MKTGAEAPVFIYCCELAIANVHRYFKAKTHFSCLRFGPHDEILLKKYPTGQFLL